MPSLQPSRISASTALVVACLILASCSTPNGTRSQVDPDVIQVGGFWQPHLLYLLASPHPRLYVEVDAVEGCIPSDAALNKLRDFLTAYCDKPGGIEVVRSDVISLEAARGILPAALARKFLSGPPDNSTSPPPAFMYALYYNGDLSAATAEAKSGHPRAKKAPRPPRWIEKPHVDRLPYPAAFYMNTRVMHKGPQEALDELPLHEAGHLLGLADRPNSAADWHCLDRTCLMYPSMRVIVRISRLLLGRYAYEFNQKQLCERCVSELARNKRQAPPSNLRFVGPVLVRSEAGYHVLSLPDHLKLILGDLTEQDCRDFAAAARAKVPVPGDDKWSVDAWAKEELLHDPAKLRDVLTRAKLDPYDHVRGVASQLEETIQSDDAK